MLPSAVTAKLNDAPAPAKPVEAPKPAATPVKASVDLVDDGEPEVHGGRRGKIAPAGSDC